ncbi:ABC transporter substrate-binding protein [Inconstantimicrobium mannanitabidum]|uniref:Basic amino acid ABC transporter substrate-binding protein n=1 Tax=Inconstantimicrobium mannanitabidum TaxID=1604901 RepID=A0ACB5R9V4_9CLOT|nr:ABC transporter substrate-binding protein [Clostridium sp. TW13]GKX65746.1 basic amino acid ABC transporter substrate-binding protein [Clostridium sp. TW13]
MKINIKHFNIFIIIHLVLVIILIYPLNTIAQAPSNLPKSRLDAIREKGVLTVVSSNDVPFAYIDPLTKEFSGLDADIIREIAKRLGINKVEMTTPTPFNDLITALNSNENIDLITDGMYVTDERKKEVQFTNTWYNESEAIVTPQISKIVFKDDLKTAVVGALRGTAFLDLAQKWKKEGSVKDVIIFDNENDLLNAVNTNKIDAAITDSIVATYLISQNTNYYLKILDSKTYIPEAPGKIAAAAKKGDTTLVEAINKVLDDMKADRTLMKILKKYGLNENYFVAIKEGHLSNL